MRRHYSKVYIEKKGFGTKTVEGRLFAQDKSPQNEKEKPEEKANRKASKTQKKRNARIGVQQRTKTRGSVCNITKTRRSYL